jgi:DNA adenine methylase
VDERVATPLAKARALVAALAPDLVEKTMWGSPAGKKRLAKRLAAMLPAHKAYTEPFAGSAAVLFAKPQVPTEAINDADPEIAAAYKIVQTLSESDLARLRAMDWKGSPETFKRLKSETPTSDVAKLYRFLYLSHFAYGKIRGKSFSPSSSGIEASTPTRVEKFAPRLKGVQVFSGDYEPVVRKFDSKDSLHFLDPPYTGYNVAVGEKGFDEERFFKLVKGLQGKFLITYGIRGKLPKLLKSEGYPIKRIRTPRTIRTMRGVGGSQFLTQIIASNYELSKKRLEDLALDGWELVEDETEARRAFSVPDAPTSGPEDSDVTSDDNELAAAVESFVATPVAGVDTAAEGAVTSAPFAKTVPLIKGLDPADERYVLGIVLEPETVDAQGDIYSEAEVRSAAHRFMEEFQGLGLMHKMRVNGEVKILECFVAPSEMHVGDVAIKKGTWLLAVRVLSDALWKVVQEGDLTGFSIGGSARRVPDAQPHPVEAA